MKDFGLSGGPKQVLEHSNLRIAGCSGWLGQIYSREDVGDERVTHAVAKCRSATPSRINPGQGQVGKAGITHARLPPAWVLAKLEDDRAPGPIDRQLEPQTPRAGPGPGRQGRDH